MTTRATRWFTLPLALGIVTAAWAGDARSWLSMNGKGGWAYLTTSYTVAPGPYQSLGEAMKAAVEQARIKHLGDVQQVPATSQMKLFHVFTQVPGAKGAVAAVVKEASVLDAIPKRLPDDTITATARVQSQFSGPDSEIFEVLAPYIRLAREAEKSPFDPAQREQRLSAPGVDAYTGVIFDVQHVDYEKCLFPAVHDTQEQRILFSGGISRTFKGTAPAEGPVWYFRALEHAMKAPQMGDNPLVVTPKKIWGPNTKCDIIIDGDSAALVREAELRHKAMSTNGVAIVY